MINTKMLEDIHNEIIQKEHMLDDPSIEKGRGGLIIYYFYCSLFLSDKKYLELGELEIERCIQMISNFTDSQRFSRRYKTDSIANQIASFGKALLFVQYELKQNYDFSDFHEQISNSLEDLLTTDLHRGDFDINSGALASGFYYLNNYRHTGNSHSKKQLKRILTSMQHHAIKNSEGELYWKSPSLSDQVYLSISHGAAMIVNFITKLFDIGVLNLSDKESMYTLEKAFEFLIRRYRNLPNGFFPAFYPDEGHKETQFSLCYGDLGIAYTLANARKYLKLDENKIIDRILKSVSERRIDFDYTYDAGITYGASGVARVFKDMHRKHGKKNYLVAYEYWYSQIQSYQTYESSDFAGFRSLLDFVNVKKDTSNNLSFSWGILGIALTIMLHENENLPDFNELLMFGYS